MDPFGIRYLDGILVHARLKRATEWLAGPLGAPAVALVVFVPTTAVAAPVSAPICEDERRLRVAREHYEKDRYLEAAQAFEALWADCPRPKFLYYAGLSHEGAGNDALAIQLWRRALASKGLDDTDIGKAHVRLASALARTVTLELRAEPAEAVDGAQLELRRPGLAVPFKLTWDDLEITGPGTRHLALEPGEWEIDIQPAAVGFMRTTRRVALPLAQRRTKLELTFSAQTIPLEIHATPLLARRAKIHLVFREATAVYPDRTLEISRRRTVHPLAPGRWTYTAKAPGYALVTGKLNLTTTRERLDLELRRAPRTPQQHDRTLRITLGTGFAVAGLGTGVAGAILLTRQWEPPNWNPAAPRPPCADPSAGESACHPTRPVAERLSYQYWSGSLLGSTVGLWGAAVIGGARPRQIPLAATAGIGGALLVAGVATRLGFFFAQKSSLESPEGLLSQDNWEQYRMQILGAGLLTGAGAGLLGGTSVGLLARYRLSVSPARAGLGVGLTSNF